MLRGAAEKFWKALETKGNFRESARREIRKNRKKSDVSGCFGG